MNTSGRVHIRVKGAYFDAAGISDPGRIRNENQDAIYLDKEGHFVLLADGMGGHERGAEASKAVIEVIQEYLQPELLLSEMRDITKVEDVPPEILGLFSLVDRGVNKANAVLYDRNRKAGLERYMGSTLVGLVPAPGSYVIWFHVGDSRLYRWRDSVLKCLTTDHSVYSEWIRKGRQGIKPAKNIVTRAIGPKEGVVPDIEWEEYYGDDIYILCSDGLNDMLKEEEMAEIFIRYRDVDDIAIRLIDAAMDAGGRDNVSVIVLKV
jgi:serine/threonine protein phosphatase PrpC